MSARLAAPPDRGSPSVTVTLRGTLSPGPGRSWLFVGETGRRVFLQKTLVTANADGTVTMSKRTAKDVGLI